MLLMKNQWFSALPIALRHGWRNNLLMVELKKGHTVGLEAREGRVFFPINCVAHMSGLSGSGAKSYFRFSGANFLIGLAELLSFGDIHYESEVCGDGYAFSLPVSVMMSAMPDRVELSSLQIRAISQIAERAFFSTHCIGTHNGSNRLARILLEASDAFGDGRHITLTQQELSDLLLLRRETVSQLLGDWSAHQIVSLRRGSIAIENRAELLAQACSCYSVIKEFERAELELWRSIRWVIPSNLKYA